MDETSKIEVKPRFGLNNLRFGATMVEAEAHFGKPQAVEHIDDIEAYKSIVWHYFDYGFSLFFDDNYRNTFSCVELDAEHTLLWSNYIFKMSEKQIVTLFNENGYSNCDTEEHAWGERRVSFDDAMVDLYFDKKKLVSINCAIPFDFDNEYFLPN